MIEQADAIQVQSLALDAIASLTKALDLSITRASPEIRGELKRGLGLSIGIIETELLSVLYRLHPSIDPSEE